MHSNFITPPDLIETILVVDATEDQIKKCAEQCRTVSKPYNVYFYHENMKDFNWLGQVIERADVVLQEENSSVPVLTSIKFGEQSPLKSPAEYFK